MDIFIHGMSRHTAEQVHLIRPRHRNQQVRLLHPCLPQYFHGSTVPLHYHDVVKFLTGFQNLQIGIDQCQIITLGRQLAGQRSPHLAVAGNYYFQ